TVGEPVGRQCAGREPPAQVGERSRDGRQDDADQGEPGQRADPAEARPRGFCWCFKGVRHRPLQSNWGIATCFLDRRPYFPFLSAMNTSFFGNFSNTEVGWPKLVANTSIGLPAIQSVRSMSSYTPELNPIRTRHGFSPTFSIECPYPCGMNPT